MPASNSNVSTQFISGRLLETRTEPGGGRHRDTTLMRICEFANLLPGSPQAANSQVRKFALVPTTPGLPEVEVYEAHDGTEVVYF